jgi:hypothetical protein
MMTAVHMGKRRNFNYPTEHPQYWLMLVQQPKEKKLFMMTKMM